MKSKSTAPFASTKNLKPKPRAKLALKDLTPKHDPKGGIAQWMLQFTQPSTYSYYYVY